MVTTLISRSYDVASVCSALIFAVILSGCALIQKGKFYVESGGQYQVRDHTNKNGTETVSTGPGAHLGTRFNAENGWNSGVHLYYSRYNTLPVSSTYMAQTARTSPNPFAAGVSVMIGRDIGFVEPRIVLGCEVSSTSGPEESRLA